MESLAQSSSGKGDSGPMLSHPLGPGAGPSPAPLTTPVGAAFFPPGRERGPAFATAADYGKATLGSSTSTHLLRGLAGLEGGRGHVPGRGAFHPVRPHSGQRAIDLEASDGLSSLANGKHPPTLATGDDGSDDKRLSRRKRKVVNPENSVCTICGLTVRPGELRAHFEVELERLNKITRPGKSTRDTSSHSKKAVPSASTSKKRKESEGESFDNLESRREEYRRVKQNRLERLNARLGRCRKGLRKTPEDATASAALCPICHEVLTGSAEDRNIHAEACLRKMAPAQADVEEEVDVDGEGEEFEEYTWCGQTRIRATSLLDSRFKEAGFEVGRKEVDCDTELNVDDDDTAEFGPEQFTEADIIPCPSDDSEEDKQRQALRDAVVGHDERASPPDSAPDPWLPSTSSPTDSAKQPNRTERLSSPAKSDVVMDCLKARIRELQSQLDTAATSRIKCLICMESFSVPLVSIQCWHVHCQQCWLRTLGAKKLCPQCNMITSPNQLRRIYL